VVLLATSSSGDIGSGCCLSILAISLKPGITRNPNHLLPGTSRGIYEERKIYKWRWERRLQSGLGEFATFGRKVKTFSWGEEDWLEEGLLVPAKKKIQEKDYRRRFSHGPRRKCATKIMCNHLEEPRRRRVTTVMYQCKHGGVVQPCPHHFAVPNVAFAEPYAHLPQPQ
jgi:hypothetical protein